MLRKIILTVVFFLIAATAQAADVTVSEEHLNFIPDTLTINKDDAVIFSNNDDVVHNMQIIEGIGAGDDKGLQKPGENTKMRFSEPGKYTIRCAIHPKMKITVTVQ